jgi:Predicted amidophosphoribosyltransferases
MRKIIHEMKYGGKKEMGETMGRNMAAELQQSNFFDGIDLLVPVVLHPKRQRVRGYNQSEWIAKGVSYVTDLPIEMHVVTRVKHVETQTRKTPFQRWENVQQIFQLEHPERLEGKHILVIDDVVTTGATALAFIESFATLKETKVSLLTLAVAAQ